MMLTSLAPLTYSFTLILLLLQCHSNQSSLQTPIISSEESVLPGNSNLVEMKAALRKLESTPTLKIIKEINTKYCPSDGEGATYLNNRLSKICLLHKNLFVHYLISNKNSCVYKAILYGFSEDFLIYDKAQREVKKKKLVLKFLNENYEYSSSQKNFIIFYINQINPSIYD
jgi:hypothetical protein